MNPGNQPARPSRFGRSRFARFAAVALPIVVVACAAFPYLPPGICHEDSGDFQVAATTLGIPHPPGYAAYVSLGHLLTRLSPLDPAYTINLACLGCGLALIGLCAHLQTRLGVGPISAATAALLLALYPEVWPQLLVPEVYLPSLLLLAGAICCLREGGAAGGRRWLLFGALLLGLLVANRPPALLYVPVFVGVCWAGMRRDRARRGRHAGDALLALIAFLLPVAYSIGYFYVRDVPANEYNYVEAAARSDPNALPAADAGVGAKLTRVAWLMTARPYHDLITVRPLEVVSNWTHVAERLTVPSFPISIFFLMTACNGFRLTLRRRPQAAWLLAGVAAAAFVYAGCYRDPGFPADLLPVVLAIAVFTGVTCSSLFEYGQWRYRTAGAVSLLAMTCFCVFAYAREKSSGAYDADATRYVAEIEWNELPRDVVIISSWRTSSPLWYARLTLFERNDVELVNADPSEWMALAAPYADAKPPRAVYFAYEPPVPEGRTFVEEHGLYRLVAPR